jgi:hypothetical protein
MPPGQLEARGQTAMALDDVDNLVEIIGSGGHAHASTDALDGEERVPPAQCGVEIAQQSRIDMFYGAVEPRHRELLGDDLQDLRVGEKAMALENRSQAFARDQLLLQGKIDGRVAEPEKSLRDFPESFPTGNPDIR